MSLSLYSFDYLNYFFMESSTVLFTILNSVKMYFLQLHLNELFQTFEF